MCRVPVKLRELVKQRLAAAAEEIFELLERTIAEYEEETERQRRLLDKLLQPRVVLNRTAESHPEPPQVKEEQEVLHSDIITSQLCSDVKTEDTAPPSEFEEVSGVSVKTEEEETQIEDAWIQPVFLPPPRGALIHRNQAVDFPGPEQDWTQPLVSLPSPGGALLHQDKHSAPSDQNHRGVSKFHICTNCGKAFSARYLLVSHMRVHTGEKPFRCSVCGKRFSQKRNFQIHMVSHTGEQPFSCSVCGKTFSQERSLQSHMVVHMSPDTAASDSSNSSNKPVCQSCGKVCRCMSELKRHMLVHTGEKPFSCSVCKKRFSLKWNLQCHMIVHTRESPFSCLVCGKSVKTIQNLRQHMALHKSRVTDRAEGAQDKTRSKLGLNQDWFKPINTC